MNLEKVNRADVEQSLKNARDELADAADASKKMHLERRIGIETVKLKALS